MLNNTESTGKAKCVEAETTPATPHHGDPLVSAIITTHNREPGMVVRAVKSVLNQTYQNIELIVVDDSSPSFAQRAEVEQSVRSISDNILYLKQKICQGACAARNTGLSHAKGYYVGFLDDDDEWMPNKVEEQLKGFCDESVALVYSPILLINDESDSKWINISQGERGYIFEPLLKRCFIGSTSNPLIKKACVEEVGGFDVLMQSCQDYDLWLRLALKYHIDYIDMPLLKYHIHPGARITTDVKKQIKGYERLNMKYAAYISKDNDTWYIRHRILIPFYQKHYGRKRALALWISCVKKCPGRLIDNFKVLVMIIMGIDPYIRLATLYQKLRGDRRV